jgi:periplasmic divalent cation tolerance protein
MMLPTSSTGSPRSAYVSEEICEVVVTGPDMAQLADFTRRLLDDRLVACGQHITSVRSLYRWNGAIQDDHEARVALHTRRSLVDEIVARADRDHPYDVPCVLALPVVAANPAYVDWVLAETAEAEA